MPALPTSAAQPPAAIPIVVAGTARGFGTPRDGQLRFSATDPRLADLDGQVFADADAARRLAEAVLPGQQADDGPPNGGRAAGQALSALLTRQPHFQAWG